MSTAWSLTLAACCFFRMFLRIILKCLLLKSATSESAVATLGACKAPPIPSVAPCGARTTKGWPSNCGRARPSAYLQLPDPRSCRCRWLHNRTRDQDLQSFANSSRSFSRAKYLNHLGGWGVFSHLFTRLSRVCRLILLFLFSLISKTHITCLTLSVIPSALDWQSRQKRKHSSKIQN